MMRRRHVLLSLVGSFWTWVSCRTRTAGSGASGSVGTEGRSAPSGAFGRRFLEDFDRSRSRPYSEEGIPVFLVGENLASAVAPPQGGSRKTERSNAWVRTQFRRCAAVLAEARPGGTEDDVGKVVEVLAERDFGTLRHPPRP